MAIFFTSDLHLGHKNILASCGRPFDTVEEMDDELIVKWNQKVGAGDDVYILGDLAFRSANHINYYLKHMAGHKYLGVGNHDVGWMKNVKDLSQYFEAVENMMLINMGKNLLTLCHYPLLEWNRSRYAQDQATSTSWLIHGHIHNSMTILDFPEAGRSYRRVDVGTNRWFGFGGRDFEERE